MKLIDTSVAVDHLRGLPAATAMLDGLLTAGEDLLASELVRFELLAGVRPNELQRTEIFFEALSWVPVSEPVARVAGDLARRHRAGHSGIDDADYLIAATALLLEVDLVTTNVRHFPMLADLRPPY